MGDVAAMFAPAEGRSRWTVIFVLGSLAIGLGIRLYFVLQPPAPSTKWDHHEYIRWGILMREEGLAALYDHPPRETLMWNHERGSAVIARHPEQFICNYPPLSAYVLFGEITALGQFDTTSASNTRIARMIYALPSILGDILIAAGCLALVQRLVPRSALQLAPGIAFGAIMVAPPFFLDSARWTQTDSWVLAPAVWMLWAMLPRAGAPPRWIVAGLLWGIALGLKTQAILFAPVWFFALLINRPRARIIAAMALAVGILLASAIPFTAHSGFRWFEESYVNNLFKSYKLTTLKAFNLWYLDLLISEDSDAGRPLLGLEKDAWGKALLAAAVFGAGVIVVRRRGNHREDLVAFTAATLLAAVILPTRVHERYILLPMPFLIVLAALRPRTWFALAPLIVVAAFQMTVLDWLGIGADGWSKAAPKLQQEYDQLREALTPEQFSAIPPPKAHFDALRAAQGREKWEWTITLLELSSAVALFSLILRPPRVVNPP